MSWVARVSFTVLGLLILASAALSAKAEPSTKAEPSAADLVDALNGVFGEYPHTRRVTRRAFA